MGGRTFAQAQWVAAQPGKPLPGIRIMRTAHPPKHIDPKSHMHR